MALRFPGAGTAEQYWRDIEAGVSHVRRFSRAELRSAGASEDLLDDPDLVGASALLDGVGGFDAAFFGMTGREAEVTDPQQRLLLECCHHALEDGGYAGSDARIGVYGSVGYRLYSLHSYLANNLADVPGDDWIAQKQAQVGNYPDFAANRAAFRLGLRGPAVNVATACSSALVSVHLACQALLAGDAELMLVASAALHFPQITGHRHVKGSTISRSGTVRAFDADADGTVGGNGVAAVLLKPLARALADGDTVHAVILGSAVTNDGDGKGGFAAPGVAGQRDAVLGALTRAGVRADSLGYLEAHGTGTFKGDPIEFAALTEAFRAHTDGTGFCALGSTKPAIGHLDSAAGLAGLIKAILVLRHGVIPPLVNFTRANPLLALETSPFVVPTRATPWPNTGIRRAGVHSIGMGGTNAHVIVEEAPGREPGRVSGGASGRAPGVLSGGASGRAPGALSGGGAGGVARGMRGGVGAGVPGGVATEVPRDVATEVPRDVATEVPGDVATGMPGDESGSAPEGGSGRGAEEVRGGRDVPALLPLSARTPEALAAYARAFRDELVRRPDLAPADLLTTTALGRRHLPHRLVVTAPFVEGLDAFLAETQGALNGTADRTAAPAIRADVPGAFTATADQPLSPTIRADVPGAFTGTVDRSVSPAFLFSGQGAGGPGMAAALAARFPVVAEVLRECARVYDEETGQKDFLARITDAGRPSSGREGTRAADASLIAHGPVSSDPLSTADRPIVSAGPSTADRPDTADEPSASAGSRTPAGPGQGGPTDSGAEEARRPGRPGPVAEDPHRAARTRGPISAPPTPWDTAFAQPAIFALQVAQLRLWRSWGVRPGSVAGHSVGEYAALCAAGALSLADGMRLLCRRGRLMQDTAPGAMLAVFAERDRVRELAAEVGRVELAVSNGPEHQVLAGPPDAVAEAHRRLTEQGLTGVPLPVDRAFHSALLDPVLDELRAAAEKAELRPVEIEFVSGLDGAVHPPGWLPDAGHLVRQARHTADFHAVLRTLAPVDALLELGPDATLTRLARRAVPDTLCVPTGGTPDEVWRAAARLHCAGAPLDWAALLEGCGGRRIPLPTYPFEHRSYWIGPPPPPTTAVPAHEPAREPDGENDVTDQAVLKRVLELTAQHLGYDQDGLRAGETYVGLGADSLQLIGMLRQLEGEFGVRLAVRELLEDAGSPELTARLIAERVARPAPEPRAEIIDVRQTPEPRKAAPQAPETPQAPGPAEYASRGEVAELRRQIDLLAETQASLITQLSEAVALLTAERATR
ncbi:acyltransferase domain-containing protein [Streptomyces sp. NBC_00490]|uniref:beta-ketoacyl synthase N-terminal-like domain-containing protein n=1 Tax=Streptomyces sp. NBC_00490 TaxID=2903657 RepID=UPI002E18F211